MMLIMDSFQPIPRAVFRPRRNGPNDVEFKREPRLHLDAIMNVSHGHQRPYTWGFTIYRTVYTPESDAAFPEALERIRHLIYREIYADCKTWKWNKGPDDPLLDPTPNDELFRHRGRAV
ncbi:hypothetical protein G7046_g9931 [Stylonectria norvegica]|nr:hypothetical protein G7046_g9931 [Stylonectria norvegica]